MSSGPRRLSFLQAASRHSAALCGFVMLAMLFYAPPAGWRNHSYFGGGADPWIYIWFLHWWPFAIGHHLSPFYTLYVDAPVGQSLAWRTSMPVLALVGAAITASLGAVATYNILMLAAPGLAAWGAYLAADTLTGRLGPSLVAGLIFGFSSYETAQLLGHLNLAFVVMVPLSLHVCVSAARRGWTPIRLGLCLGLLLAAQFGIAQEVFASNVVFGTILFLVAWIIEPEWRCVLRRLLPGLAIAIALCLALVSPLIWQMIWWYRTGSGSVSSPVTVSSDLLNLLLPTPVTWIGGHALSGTTVRFIGDVTEQGGYVGLPLLVLLIQGWRRHRRDAAFHLAGLMALAVGILSLGPYVHVLGHTISTAPWIVAANLPFLRAMLPGRFVLYGWLAISMLIALWLSVPGHGIRRYLVVLCCLLFVLPDRAFTRRWTSIAAPDIFTQQNGAGTIPRGNRILILPEHGYALRDQFLSGMAFRLVGQGYLGNGQPAPFARWHLFQPLFDNDFADIDPAEFSAYLSTYGVQHVVVLRSDRAVAHEAVQAERLLQGAGWLSETVTHDAVIFGPSEPAPAPASAGRIARFMTIPSSRSVRKRVDGETAWVCGIRKLARATALDPTPLLRIYMSVSRQVLPTAAITCRPS